MKLRTRGDSLRLRLTRSEVDAIRKHGEVSDRVRFAPGSVLTYRLQADDNATGCRAEFSGDEVLVSVAASVIGNWAASEQVSIEAFQPLGDGESLRILIEKDFACLAERPHEDDSDAFPHPGS